MQHQARTALCFAIIVSLGGFVFGFDATVINGVQRFITIEFGLSDTQLGYIVGAPSLGGLLAAATVGPISDRIGRRTMLQVMAAFFLVSAMWSAFADSYWSLLIARALGGYAFGSLGLAPMYIAETSPARQRGIMVAVNQLNIVIGLAASYFTNYFWIQIREWDVAWVSALSIDTDTWRWMLGLEVLPAAIWFVALFRIPESPRWLFLHGRLDEARSTLSRITAPETMDSRSQDLESGTSGQQAPLLARIRELFNPRLRFVLLIGALTATAQQITGINAVFFYATSIFEQMGVGTNAAFAQTLWVGIINIIFTLIAMAIIDRFGRRPLMIAGLLGVALSMSLTSWGFSKAEFRFDQATAAEWAATTDTPELVSLADRNFHSDVEFKSALKARIDKPVYDTHEPALLAAAAQGISPWILVGILGFVASFAISLGPVMWVLHSEIFPNSVRAVCMATAGLVNTGVSYAVQVLFPVANSTFGAANTFLFFAVSGAIFLILMIWLLPETRGRSLEQIEEELCSRKQGKAAA